MLDDQTVTYTLAAVGLLLILMVVYNQRMAGRERQAGNKEDGPSRTDLLVKFARHEGSVVGESVAISGDHIILKQANVFKSVSLDHAQLVGDEIVLTGEIDWDAAVVAGDAWRTANTKGHDPLVTEHLTRSEDVRNPALEALQEREGDAGADADDSEE